MAIVAMTYVTGSKVDLSCSMRLCIPIADGILYYYYFFTIISFQINHAKILAFCAMSPLKIRQRLSSDYWTYSNSFNIAFKTF